MTLAYPHQDVGPNRQNQRGVSSADAELGHRIRQLRLARDKSQSELAAAAGVTFQQIQKYENGTNRVSVTRLLAIATFLDVPATEFLPPSEVQHDPLPSLSEEAIRLGGRWSKIPNPETKRAIAMLVAQATTEAVAE